MDKQSNKILGLFSRYAALILLGLGNLYLFYKILTPLTIKSVSFVLGLFSSVTTIGSMIYFKGIIIEIIPACVAGAAFYLLVILVISTPEIKPSLRAKILITSLLTLFILNILRILLLTAFIKTPQFTALHWIFWHLISTLFIVAIWITHVKIYKIKTIPIVSDVKYLRSLIKPRKKSKRGKKN